MSRRTVAFALFVALFTAENSARAESSGVPPPRTPFELTADSVEFESSRSIYVARGNVRIKSKDTELTADWLAFNDNEARGVATGHVVYRAHGDVLNGSFIEFDIDGDRGILFDANFEPDSSEFRLEGDTIVRHGDDRYSFENGMFTSCLCPEGEREPWKIRADSADLDVGGYATARNTTFEILGVPVVWLPWMVYPIKTERESGFLFPTMAFGSRSGFAVGLPFFWAVTEGMNVTATPQWLSARGFKGNVDLDYVYGEESEGRISGAFIHDERIDPHTREYPFGRERWALHGTQDIHLPAGLRARSTFQFVSDNEYLSDFDDLPADRDDRFLESNVFVGRSFGESGRFGGLASVFYFNDLQNPNDRDRDDFLLQRLPTLAATALPAPAAESNPLLSRMVPAFDFEYTFFKPRHRAAEEFSGLSPAYNVGNTFIDTGIDALADPMEDGYPANPDPHGDDTTVTTAGFELDGTFQEGEPLADDGSRIDFFPRLGLPFRLGDYVEAYPEIGWHQTVYDSHFGGTAERHLLTARLDLRSRLVRRFGANWIHLVEPRVGYALVNDLGQDQDNNPLFVPMTAVPQLRVRQLDLRNVTNDSADRVRDFNGVTIGVANRIYRRGTEGASDLVADFYVSSQIQVDDGELGNFFVGGRFYPTERTYLWADLGYDPEANNVSEALLQLGHEWLSGHAFRVSYRYVRHVPFYFEDFESSSERFENFTENFQRINQIRLYARLALTSRWAVYDRVSYTFEDSLLLKNRFGVEYVSKCRCWAGGVEFTVNRSGGFRVGFTTRLLGLGGPFENRQLTDMGLLDGF